MVISVVVSTFNRREIVLQSLETLFTQSVSPSVFEVIVVVDGSTDGTGDALRALRPQCRLRVIEQENRGLAGARNTGYRAAESDLVLFLDDDMLCDPGLIEAHLAAHETPFPLAGFGALFLSQDSPQSLAAECFRREIGAFHLKRRRDPKTQWQPSECVFSNSSLPRRVLEELGGFDERFRMREDQEFGVRLFAAGVTPRYIDGATAYQYYNKTSADLIRDAEAFAVADVHFGWKHPEAEEMGQVSRYMQQPGWKRRLHGMVAAFPAAADALLVPFCAMGEAFFSAPALRNAGVRALQMRRRIHWLYVVGQIERLPPEDRPGKAG
jgi:glycosyltransferase involved in cell wall biosynthesis